MYEDFTKKIAKYCAAQSADFLLVGPVSRPCSNFENQLSDELNDIFTVLAKAENIKYLDLLGEKTKDNQSMFFADGQHVSQDGHDEIAAKIFEKIKRQSSLVL
jgi:lysophospholipase L1-like esterase